MKKYFLISILLFWFSLDVLCQSSEEHKADSLKIDSLRRILPKLKDKALVDCLNELAEKFTSISKVGGFVHKTDSMFLYGSKANEEANRLGYKYGIVVSLLNLTRSKQFDQQITASEKYIRQALSLASELNDDHLLGPAYYLLAGLESPIENYKKAIYYFKKTGDVQQETEVTTWLCMAYSDKGEYEDGFQYCDKCIQLARANVKKDTTEWGHELVQWSFFNMYILYKAAGDYETGMDYLLKGYQYANANHLGWKMYADISELYCQMGKYDSALNYWNIWKKDWDSYAVGHQAYGNTVLAQIYLRTNKPDEALPLLKGAIATFRQKGREMGNAMIRPLFFTGDAYNQRKNPSEALKYVKEGLQFAEEKNLRPEMMDGYQLISTIYYQLGRTNKAYEYLLKSISIKDSIQNRQFLLRLYNYKREAENAKKESQISLLNKDNKIKEQQLKQQATFRNFLVAIFIALVFAGLYVFRNIKLKRKNEKLQREQTEQEWKLKHLESEKKQAELQQQATELEMQALRAQMNPHFIFNCLSSINRFILKNESKTASNYLTRFSRLIRMVLMNSQKPLITLEEELQMLRLYLDMEQLRFRDSFDYTISFTNAMDAEAIFIPPLILQPFCENAIWHGLMHKEGPGHLTIDLTMQNNILNCIIVDDGIGREKAAELEGRSGEKTRQPDGKEKSMGLKITTQRLALLNQEKNVHTFYTIEDIIDENKNIAGTKVILKIGHKELMEEYA